MHPDPFIPWCRPSKWNNRPDYKTKWHLIGRLRIQLTKNWPNKQCCKTGSQSTTKKQVYQKLAPKCVKKKKNSWLSKKIGWFVKKPRFSFLSPLFRHRSHLKILLNWNQIVLVWILSAVWFSPPKKSFSFILWLLLLRLCFCSSQEQSFRAIIH